MLLSTFILWDRSLNITSSQILPFRQQQNSFSQSFQSLNHVWLYATPWTAACQATLSITNSGSLLKLMSIESVTLVPKKIKPVTVSIDSPSICHNVMGPDDVIYSMDMSLSKLWEFEMGREAWHHAVHGATTSQTWLSIWTELNWLGDAIQPSHSLSSPSPLAFNHSQHQRLFQWQS